MGKVAKQRSRNNATTKTRNSKRSNVNKPEKDLTENEWSKMSLEVLRLKCQAYNLVTTGRKPDLAHRLHLHFHADEVDEVLHRPPDDVFVENDDERPPPPRDTQNGGNNDNNNNNNHDGDENSDKNNNNGSNNSTQTVPWQETPAELDNLIDARVNNVLQGIVEELQVARAELQSARDAQNLSAKEVLALRSEVRSLKQRQTIPGSRTATATNTNAKNISVSPTTNDRAQTLVSTCTTNNNNNNIIIHISFKK
jgi:hypothetical protein